MPTDTIADALAPILAGHEPVWAEVTLEDKPEHPGFVEVVAQVYGPVDVPIGGCSQRFTHDDPAALARAHEAIIYLRSLRDTRNLPLPVKACPTLEPDYDPHFPHRSV